MMEKDLKGGDAPGDEFPILDLLAKLEIAGLTGDRYDACPICMTKRWPFDFGVGHKAGCQLAAAIAHYKAVKTEGRPQGAPAPLSEQ